MIGVIYKASEELNKLGLYFIVFFLQCLLLTVNSLSDFLMKKIKQARVSI